MDAGRSYVRMLSSKNPNARLSELTADERLRVQEAKNALDAQNTNTRLERYHFDQIVAEGVRAASQWKRTVDK